MVVWEVVEIDMGIETGVHPRYRIEVFLMPRREPNAPEYPDYCFSRSRSLQGTGVPRGIDERPLCLKFFAITHPSATEDSRSLPVKKRQTTTLHPTFALLN